LIYFWIQQRDTAYSQDEGNKKENNPVPPQVKDWGGTVLITMEIELEKSDMTHVLCLPGMLWKAFLELWLFVRTTVLKKGRERQRE
jgi:hypothetical protein